MRTLRKRPRSDNIANQSRRPAGNMGRRIYLALLILIGIGAVNYLWGDFVTLRGEGLVLRDKTVVATSYVARVTAVHVREAEDVEKGDALLQISSTDLLERLADMSIRQASVKQMATELHLRLEIARRLLPQAKRRDDETRQMLLRLENTANSGYVTTASYREALQASFSASSDITRLSAENEILRSKIDELDSVQANAANALKQLRDSYGDGTLRAAVKGSVGAQLPSVGDVYRPGEPILSVYSGEPYILAYLPSRYLFEIRPGMKVVVSSGRERGEGVISEILPLSDVRPQEFQDSFRPRDRNQLAKISLSNPAKFPMGEKVWISQNWILP